MTYRFARERVDYSDFATGRVLYSAPDRTAFPVRLADEIFQRCLTLSREVQGRALGNSPHAGLILYDPVCGSGALLATLVFLHGKHLAAAIGSDANSEALRLAGRNLDLLTPADLDARLNELMALHDRYGKVSHASAVDSARRLRHLLVDPPVPTYLFQADATDPGQILEGIRAASKLLDLSSPHPDPLPRGEGRTKLSQQPPDVEVAIAPAQESPLPAGEGQGEGVPGPRRSGAFVDVVIADVPHGVHSVWRGRARLDLADPLGQLLESLKLVLAPNAIVAIASDKAQRARHAAYVRREWFQIGKRRIELLSPAS